MDCSSEDSLWSEEAVYGTYVEFVNETGVSVEIYWLDYDGRRVLYNRLSPGQKYLQQTFVTHPWMAVDSTGRCLGIYLPDWQFASVTLR